MTTLKFEQWYSQGRLVDVLGYRLFVREQGSGPLLLLIHGFPTSSWDWHKLTPSLANKFRILSIDLLGYGYSEKPRNCDYSTRHQALLLYQLLKQYSVKQVHLMAFSYGASLVQEMLATAIDQGVSIESVCFLNGGLFLDSNHPKLPQRLMLGPWGKHVVKLFTKNTLARNLRSIFGPNTQPSKELIEQYWSLIQHNNGKPVLPKLIQYLKERQSHSERWEQAMMKATCPMLLIVGTYDTISGIEVAQEFQQKLPHQSTELLDDIGHYPQLECPETVLLHYDKFVKGLEGMQ